ncbi:MAG: RHS repeat-associated core domain-containing protein, partial [Micromonosporaceae bacterium]
MLLALKPAGTSYTFDPQGNRTSVTSLNGTTVNHAYDQANRLTGYGTTATYRYNGAGLRTSKTVSGVTTDFVWSVAEGLPLLLSEGTTNYIYGPGGLPLERVDSTGAVVYYHHDQLGSTRALSNATGAVVATYTYDAYGNLTASTGSAVNPFRYAGQYTDSESGYQYLRARYYDPTTASFLTRDPQELETGQPYSYANNSPLNFTDPTGEIAWVAAAAIGWGAFEVGSAVMDAFSTAGTLADPCASGLEKLASGGLFILGMAGPGGGYSSGARATSLADRAMLGRQLASQQQMAEAGFRMAGPGTRVSLRDAPRLASQYGGSPDD